MKTVKAQLDIEVVVDCPIPECDHLIDLMDENDTSGHNHNEEGSVITQACPEGRWIDEHKKFIISNVKCSKCGESFNVRGLEW